MVCSVRFRRVRARLRNAPVSPLPFVLLFMLAAFFLATVPALASHPDLRDIGQEGDPGDGVLNPSVFPEGKNPGAGDPQIAPVILELDSRSLAIRWMILPVIFYNGMPVGDIYVPGNGDTALQMMVRPWQDRRHGSSSTRRWTHAP